MAESALPLALKRAAMIAQAPSLAGCEEDKESTTTISRRTNNKNTDSRLAIITKGQALVPQFVRQQSRFLETVV